MINYTINSKSNRWSRRIKKVDGIIGRVLYYKKDLKFVNNINYYCNFILANDKFVKKLNRKYKKINNSTDVLTFITRTNFKNKKEEKHCDIVFGIETIYKDACKNKIDFYNHMTHLIIHSFLHINDYVHFKLKDFLVMKKIEVNILKQLGIGDPYLI
tara:strand:+ start:2400 stop:2870 length:471 start_codon:yes stop_codon:yes gene_type:complete